MISDERIDAIFGGLPTSFFAELLKYVTKRGELGTFRDWLDEGTYDPFRPGGRGRFADSLLWAADEALSYGSDPGEALRAIVAADWLAAKEVTADLTVRERVAALRPANDDGEGH